jgi:hypothetical protein
MWHIWEKVRAYRGLVGKCEERNHLEDLVVHGSSINWQVHVCISLGEIYRYDEGTLVATKIHRPEIF